MNISHLCNILHSSTTAASDGTAATVVGVSLCPGLAVVVGSTPLRAWHCVPLQSSIADVLCGGQDTPVDLRVHVKLILSHALCNGTLATGLGRNKAQPVIAAVACIDDHGCEEQAEGQEENNGRGLCHLLLVCLVVFLFWQIEEWVGKPCFKVVDSPILDLVFNNRVK